MPAKNALERVKALTGKEVTFYRGDILDRDILNEIMEKEKIDCCHSFCRIKSSWRVCGKAMGILS